MPIRISGLGSGLDIESIVTQMMQAKRIPIDRMKQKMTQLEWQRDAYRDMNTEMNNFLKEAQKLTLQSTFLAKKASLTSSDAERVQVTPTANAVSGNFTLQVKQVAKNATITSNAALGLSSDTSQAVATANTTLRITGELGVQDVSIANGDNINQIISKINEKTSTTGVKAIYDQLSDKLTLTSTQTGSVAKVKIEDLSATNILRDKLKIAVDPTPNDTGLVSGQDAIVNFNNTGDTTVRSNSFSLQNINFTLLKDPDTLGVADYTINASINSDVDKIVDTVKSVFDKYNELIVKVNSKLQEKKYRDFLPLTDAQKEEMKEKDIDLWEEKAKSGLLRGDSILRTGLDKMRRFLADGVSGIPVGQYDSLADIGITTSLSDGSNNLAYLENGKIYVDEDKLRNALTNSPDQVATLFTKDGARGSNGRLSTWNDAGVGTRLYEIVNYDIISGLTQKTQIVPTKSYLNREIDDYSKRINQAESGLSRYEQELYSRYSKMEEALNKLNSQSSYLASFFQK